MLERFRQTESLRGRALPQRDCPGCWSCWRERGDAMKRPNIHPREFSRTYFLVRRLPSRFSLLACRGTSGTTIDQEGRSAQ